MKSARARGAAVRRGVENSSGSSVADVAQADSLHSSSEPSIAHSLNQRSAALVHLDCTLIVATVTSLMTSILIAFHPTHDGFIIGFDEVLITCQGLAIGTEAA